MSEPTPTRSGSDRNLLFGILALQLDFISREALVAAMSAWVLDKAKSLGQILFEQDRLRKEQWQALDLLVNQHLKAHGDDLHRSLAAVAVATPLREELNRLADGELQASLQSIVSPQATGAEQTVDYLAARGDRTGSRYEILRTHATGGLGEVFVALDAELHREVALKEIHQRCADDPHSRSRFLLEAQITGGLEHPGIVPVYGLGQYADGRPYYAMRFIQGDSLKDAIKGFHAADEPGRDSGERSLALRQLLRRFIDVCNAVAYAHSRGVLHRDLKPANIMLGRYGETLVVDWGLAKAVGRSRVSPAEDQATLRPPSASGVDATQAGRALGTPAYMSPEQAAGQLDRLSPASDVYSLGATLYTLLTGQPPVAARHLAEVLEKVRGGQVVSPRQVKADVPEALASVCLKALAREPEQRYPGPLELAADVEHWLADEPVTAWREPWAARLGRWGRRHKTAVAGAAALLATAVVALALSTVFITQEQRRTEAARQQEAAERDRAERNFGAALEAVDRMLTRVGAERLARVPQMEEERQQLLEDALGFYRGFLDADSHNPQIRHETGRAYQKMARIYRMLGNDTKAEAAYQEVLALQIRLAAEFDKTPEYVYAQALTHQGLGELHQAAGDNPEAKASYQEALDQLASLAGALPPNPVYQSAVADVRHSMGTLHRKMGQLKQAEAEFQEALKTREQLAREHPDILDYQQALARTQGSRGRLYNDQGRKAPAEDAYRAALHIQKQLVDRQSAVPDYQIDLAKSYTELGRLYGAAGRPEKAEAAFTSARDLRQRLVKDHPKIPEYRNDLGQIHYQLGELYDHCGGREVEAAKVLGEGLALQEQLVRDQPNEPQFAVTLVQITGALAALRQGAGDLKEAFRGYDRGIRTLETVLQKEEGNVQARWALSCHHMGRAEVWILSGHPDQALKDWDRMIVLGEGQTHADLRVNRAMALAHRGQHRQATAEMEGMLAGGLEPEYGAYNYVCVYSLSAAAALADTSLSPAGQKKLAEHYAVRAVELLDKMRGSGFFKGISITYLKKDTDLKSLQSRDDFQKLFHRMEEEAKAAPRDQP